MARAWLPCLILIQLLICQPHHLGAFQGTWVDDDAQVHAYHTHVGDEMAKQVASVVTAQQDTLAQLSDKQRRRWNFVSGASLNTTIEQLVGTRVEVDVEVKLVGFSGDGNTRIQLYDHDLLRYLRALQMEEAQESVTLQPSPKPLLTRPMFRFTVTRSDLDLYGAVHAQLQLALRSAPSSKADDSLALVPHGVVDGVLRQDHIKSGTSGYVLYIVNPQPAGRRYAYSYDQALKSCYGQLWSSDLPYAWIDLTADPAFYGPGPSGQGQVFDESVPRLERYGTGTLKAQLLPDLATLIWQSSQHLFWAPVQHSSVSFRPRVVVHVTYIHEGLQQTGAWVDREYVQRLLQMAVGRAQKVEVREEWMSFAECDACVAAFGRALKTRTGRIPGKGYQVSSHQFLDSMEMQSVLSDLKDSIMADAHIHTEVDGSDEHVLPVFVFDVHAHSPLLLDGWRQAASLPGEMVIAVRTLAETMTTFFTCNGEHVVQDPRNLSRAVLAEVLQTGWGVADTGVSWSEATGRDWNYLWSLGNTPFSPLSHVLGVSFVQMDAALRNMALLHLNNTLTLALKVLRGLDRISPNGHAKAALMPDQVRTYTQRINMIQFKVAEAAALLGARKFVKALDYAVSLQSDVGALHRIAKKVHQGVTLDLTCHSSKHNLLWYVPIAAFAIAVAGFVFRVLRNARGSRKSRDHAF